MILGPGRAKHGDLLRGKTVHIYEQLSTHGSPSFPPSLLGCSLRSAKKSANKNLSVLVETTTHPTKKKTLKELKGPGGRLNHQGVWLSGKDPMHGCPFGEIDG